MLVRISATCILLIAMVLAPYWLFLALLIIACIITPLYIEGAVLALLHDSFFSATSAQLFGFRSVTLLVTVATMLVVYIAHTIFRKRI